MTYESPQSRRLRRSVSAIAVVTAICATGIGGGLIGAVIANDDYPTIPTIAPLVTTAFSTESSSPMTTAAVTVETTAATTVSSTVAPTSTTAFVALPTAHDACRTMVTRTYGEMYDHADVTRFYSDALHSGQLPDRETFLRLGFSLAVDPDPVRSGRYDYWLDRLRDVAGSRSAVVYALSAATYDVCSPLLEHWPSSLREAFRRSHFGNVQGGWYIHWYWNSGSVPARTSGWQSTWHECAKLRSIDLVDDCPDYELP